MGFGFHSKVIYGKSGILVCDFLVSCDSRVGPVSQTAIVQIFHVGTAKTLYSIRSCFATGAQNTLHRQQKKERIKVNHLWPHFLVIPNSPVQFCPFPVYPGWQSHTCDPLVLVQFAFTWQELLPLHSSTSIQQKQTKNNNKSDKPKQNKTKIYKRANEDYVTTKYYYILRFSTSYNETNSRHFQQLKNSSHTSIKKKTNKIKKKNS